MKILYITTISATMGFFPEHIKMLQQKGHTVELAANMTEPLKASVAALECKFHQLDFSRSPLSPDNKRAYKQLKKLLNDGNYDIVHTHTPNASAMVRLAARKLRKNGLKVFYTAHGFHFYKGAPIKNWLLYYPVEWLCARWTDTLITINTEDYERAKKHFHAKKVEYVSGVGLDLSRFQNVQIDRLAKRRELGISKDAIILMSVGELNTNKNHQIVIRAIAQLYDYNIHYIISGSGDQQDVLLRLATELNVTNRVHLLGFRSDIPELYYASDICCFPSIREGLGMAALEGMACGLPLVATDNRGVRDYCTNGKNGFLCNSNSVNEFKNAIKMLSQDTQLRKRLGIENISAVEPFSKSNVLDQMRKIYFD